MKPLFSDGFVFVIFGKRDLLCLISRSFCGHRRKLTLVSDLFRCHEDVKPLCGLLLCLLNERGRKIYSFVLICF